ncbi:hypothetical protein D3791_10585 [Glutamicibacter mishrai]|uniref:Uncharacterized protein n=1 Tax=Glutamicibacter mishrai TaxID=1775880 RepID=A0A6H0SMF8_9MICC|nr:hypothetical protein D3791_10585 [Glutamicibacter mishrai]
MHSVELSKNITVLTKAHPVKHIDPENGSVSYPNETSLFEQIRKEIGSSSRRGGKSGSGSRSPVALAAVALWSEIQESLNTSYIANTGTENPELPPETKLDSWASFAKDEETIIRCVETTSQWIAEIRELINPEPSVELVGRCPACGNTHAFTEQDGETIRNTALNASMFGANCRSCGAHWEPKQFEDLKHQIR